MRNGIFAGVFFVLFALAAPARAQDAGDGTLHVLRPVIHAEQEEAELCLEFDHDLDPAERGRIALTVKLESGGHNLSIKPQNISVIANLLCLPSLEHRREYRIVVTGLRGAKGEKLASPYGFVFTAPDRQPALSFTGNAEDEGMARWQDNDPVLRSINVPRVHIDLYRVSDPVMMAAAWRDRQQTTLAPSESATFGHDHGEVVWSGELVLGDTPNKTLEQTVPLHDKVVSIPPGLYLIVARAPEAETKTDTDEEAAIPLAATGAAWLLRSGLRIRTVRDAGGVYGLAEKSDGSAAAQNIRLLAEDADGRLLTEIRSDTNGVGFLPLDGDKANNAKTLVGIADAGDVDFADLTLPMASHFVSPENEISLTMDKTFYFPASAATVTFMAHDAQGRPLAETGTELTLARIDGSAYTSIPVPSLASGTAQMNFPVPAATGIWSLVWRKADGGTLAEASLHVTADPDAPHLEVSADRAIVSRDGDLNLIVKSVTGDGRPDPYVAGRVSVAWTSPDTIFHEWKDYDFGNGGPDAGEASPLLAFVTDEKGVASLHLTLTPPDDHAPLHSAILSLGGDGGTAGLWASAPLILPVKPQEGIVGIKPLAPGARFPENGFARFAVVMLDPDGHRRDADDLSYQIYEEGRSFDWYQAEGRWNYKPQPQRRRVGGGALTLGANGDNIIEWPVAAGTYRLEITDASGAVRASMEFSAGWGLPDAAPSASPLALTLAVPAWQIGRDIQARFTLDRPAVVTAFIGDDRIRKIIHKPMQAGENTVAFTPEKDWNGRMTLRVEAEALNLAGQAVLSREVDAQNPAQPDETKNVPLSEALTIDAVFPPVLGAEDSAYLSLNFSNNGKTAETYRYALSGTPDLKVTGAGAVTIPAGQRVKIPFTLTALHAGDAAVKLDIAGPLRFHANREWTIPVRTEEMKLGAAVRQRIEPQQSTSWPPSEKAHAKEDNVLFLSAAPLYGAPALLANIQNANIFTTGEVTGVLETLRLWRGTIIASGLSSETDLARRERNLLLRLLARQMPDGGFAPVPGEKADFISTSQALVALAHNSAPVAKPAMEQAANWLRQRLENTWFDERERPERAAAYAALAESNHLDNASLHYFSDTSAQKTLPPLAAAQLAFAFAKIGDQPASSFWIDTSGVRKDLTSLPVAILPVLAANGFFDPQGLLPSMDALSAGAASGEIEPATDFLRAVWSIQNRKGSWRVTINTDKRNPKDVLVISAPAKTAAPVIHNTGGDPIFLTGMQKIAVLPAVNSPVTRYIYQLNGTEMDARNLLARDATYLVVLEGPWPGNASSGSVHVHDDLAPALRAMGCLPPPPIEADDSLAWLKSQTLTPSRCETWEGGIDMLLTRKEGGASSWRAAYLIRAQGTGIFSLWPASVDTLLGGHIETVRTAGSRIEIR